MMEYKYLNEELDIKIGDVFYHKADGRRMVVTRFARPDNDRRTTSFDKNKPFCRFYDNQNNRYNEQEFIFDELTRESTQH